VRSQGKRPGPGAQRKLDLRSKEHGKILDWVLSRLDYSADAKRDIEREASIAHRHLTSFLDEAKHPFPTKIYDPVFTGAMLAKQAKAASALFDAPPLLDYMAEWGTPEERAQIISSVMEVHVRAVKPRRALLDGYLGTCTAGTQFFYVGWEFEEQRQWVWQRSPRQLRVQDPVSGRVSSIWSESGDWEYQRRKVTVKDNPSLRDLHITQIYPDDTVSNVQDCGWIIVRDELSGREVRNRVRTDLWDKKAVELAVAGERPVGRVGERSLSTHLDWMREIGMRPSGSSDSDMLGSQHGTDDANLRCVEVLECWRRTRDGIERTVVLNRAWIAWHGMSPFGDGRYPFLMARNQTTGNAFWGISDYRISRYLIRGIQTMRNAAASEALVASMPPLLIPSHAQIHGQRWEPRATWYLEGISPMEVQWLQSSGAARQIAHAEADTMQQRMDVSIGSSDPGRGGIGAVAARAKATTMAMVGEMAGLRDKKVIDDFAQDVLVNLGELWLSRCRQYQDYELQVKLSGSNDGEPITVWPEDLRDAQVYAISVPSITALKELHKRRLTELYELAMKSQEPNLDRRALVAEIVDAILPGAKEKLMRSQQDVAAEQGGGGPGGPPGMPPGMMGPGGPPPGIGAGLPGMPDGINLPDLTGMGEMAAGLSDAYAG